MTEERKTSLLKFLKNYWWIISILITAVFTLAVFHFRVDFHIENADRHLTPKEHYEIMNHITDKGIHLDVQDRINLQILLEQVTEMKADIKEIKEKVKQVRKAKQRDPKTILSTMPLEETCISCLTLTLKEGLQYEIVICCTNDCGLCLQ